MSRRDPERLALWLAQGLLAAVLALSLLLALVVPYHHTDALLYGQLSQGIAREGALLVDGAPYVAYARPLFLVPQGVLWWLLGEHEGIGRLLSLGFFALLLWAVFRLAEGRALPPAAPWAAVLALLAVPDVVAQAFAGQTDVPVAAMLAVAGVLAWRAPARPRTAALLVLAAAAAVLAKSTALPALAGLMLACLVGDRAGLRERLVMRVAPLAGGTALALVYDVAMARHFGMSLDAFLGGAVTGDVDVDPGTAQPGVYVAPEPVDVGPVERAADALRDFVAGERLDVLLRAEWLGPYLRLLVVAALLYALLRVARAAHRTAVVVAVAAAVVWYVAGADGSVLDAGAGALAASLAVAAVLAAAAWCPPDAIPGRAELARLLVWSLPALLAWSVFGILGDTRTLSPAWPGLIVLAGATFAMGVAGLRTRSTWAAAAAVVVLVGMAALDLRNLDALGARPDGSIDSVRALRQLTPSTWTDPEAARVAADAQLGGLVRDVRAVRPPGGRVWTNDGRQGFFFGDDVDVRPAPADCASLRGYRVVAVLSNVSPDFDGSRLPCLELAHARPGEYEVWTVR